MAAACPLCAADGGRLVLRTPRWRLIHAEGAGFPAFYRLVWNAHVAEFSDLDRGERAELTEALALAEQLIREHLAPTKMNVASLGNMVPHLHWHLIARFEGDSHFPAPVWATAVREPDAAQLEGVRARLPALESAMRERMASAR
ncbi:HIT family protein [Ramlibacter rhizophilus]|uniref:HIT family protein n=1 Tax=Ramlibacter rhizophilus TaxID=1781167 RepID=A0A4Z0BT74_9BURK|nr:HIT family protein [Ramlibacter rhizophilus]TFZ01448.1 HIT family protein [Ramlibacter rhizophilus]